MPKTVEAIYEKGVLRPIGPIRGLREYQRVAITIEKSLKRKYPFKGLCGILPDEDATEMLKIIEEEFEKVDINEW